MPSKITVLGEGGRAVRAGMSGCTGAAELFMPTQTTGMSKGVPAVWACSLHGAERRMIKMWRESPLFILSGGEADL